MKLIHSRIVFFTAISVILAGASLGLGESNPDNTQPRQSIIGSWSVDSLSILIKPGEKLRYPSLSDNRPFSVIITEKSLAIRRAGEVFAEMSYDPKSQLTSNTIDGEHQNEGVLGIYKLNGDRLKISLNNVNNGRPENYDKKENDCVLILSRVAGQPLMLLSVDKDNLRPLMQLPDYTVCGSPNWSKDGGKIAFDCWRAIFNESHTQSRVFTVNSDGTSPKDLGDGALPSFSPDGKQIACQRYNENSGVWIMNADGSGKRLIDKDGTCPRWSPKGDELAYELKNNLCTVNLKTDKRRSLLEKSYTRVVWGFCWSPDAEWICFKGTLPNGGSETALVNGKGQANGLKILAPNKATPGLKSTESSFSWSPDGKYILISTALVGDANSQLYLLDPEGKSPPKKLSGQDPNCRNFCSAWSPDGKNIVLAFWPGKIPQKNNQSGSIFKNLFGL